MKSAVLVFPGSNREGDVARALTRITGFTGVRSDEVTLGAGLGVALAAASRSATLIG